MRKYVLFLAAFLLFSQFWVNAHSQTKPIYKNDVDYPQVPRVSAYEAYSKYKAGKAIILHAGGQQFNDRHIIGALNFDVKPREHLINRLPKMGIEIFTYCY